MHGDGDTISMQIRSPKAMKKDSGLDNNELHRVISAKYVTPKDKVIESSMVTYIACCELLLHEGIMKNKLEREKNHF